MLLTGFNFSKIVKGGVKGWREKEIKTSEINRNFTFNLFSIQCLYICKPKKSEVPQKKTSIMVQPFRR